MPFFVCDFLQMGDITSPLLIASLRMESSSSPVDSNLEPPKNAPAAVRIVHSSALPPKTCANGGRKLSAPRFLPPSSQEYLASVLSELGPEELQARARAGGAFCRGCDSPCLWEKALPLG